MILFCFQCGPDTSVYWKDLWNVTTLVLGSLKDYFQMILTLNVQYYSINYRQCTVFPIDRNYHFLVVPE